MSFEPLPHRIEQGVNHFALEQRISHDEAVVRLIETGLSVVASKTASVPHQGAPRIPGLSGKPMSDDDATMMDEIVHEAMEARRQRWERYLSA